VSVQFVNLVTSGATADALLTLPAGFITGIVQASAVPVLNAAFVDLDIAVKIDVLNSGFISCARRTSFGRMYATITYELSGSDPWPASLPGTQVSPPFSG
jgi:hypothetical protein